MNPFADHDLLPWVEYAALWAAFGLGHSFMAGAGFKVRWVAWLGRWGGAERLIYNAIALLWVLALLTWGRINLPRIPLWQPHGAVLWGLALVQGAAVLMLLLALRGYDLGRFAGWRQWRAARSGQPLAPEPLVLTALHGWTRHPLYTGTLLLLWARPLDTLVLATNLCATGYLLVGSQWEERRLLAQYGAVYAAYRDRVPALCPRPWRRLNAAGLQALRG
ncbi:MAG: hypothetical protein H7831_05395 [Magnetococcus sp. WYHC-3]